MESHLMRSYRTILAARLKAAGLRQSDVARELGYNSPSAIGMMLAGKRGIGRMELERMCSLAGITLVELAAKSDDLKLTNTPEATEGAGIIDGLSPEKRALAIQMLKAMS